MMIGVRQLIDKVAPLEQVDVDQYIDNIESDPEQGAHPEQ
jgi:hypothetical protein